MQPSLQSVQVNSCTLSRAGEQSNEWLCVCQISCCHCQRAAPRAVLGRGREKTLQVTLFGIVLGNMKGHSCSFGFKLDWNSHHTSLYMENELAIEKALLFCLLQQLERWWFSFWLAFIKCQNQFGVCLLIQRSRCFSAKVLASLFKEACAKSRYSHSLRVCALEHVVPGWFRRTEHLHCLSAS